MSSNLNYAAAAFDRSSMAKISNNRTIGLWLMACCALVFIMVVVGGVTRLTKSGLSIVEWEPVIGAVPPLSDAGWQEAFAQYQAIPEAQTWSVGAAADNLAALIAESPDRGARLGRALIACRKKIGREIPQKLAALLAAT